MPAGLPPPRPDPIADIRAWCASLTDRVLPPAPFPRAFNPSIPTIDLEGNLPAGLWEQITRDAVLGGGDYGEGEESSGARDVWP